MTLFRFRLDRLLDLRSRKERERAEALGAAMREEAARRAALERAQARLGHVQDQAAAGQQRVTPAGTLHNLGLTVAAASHAHDSAAAARSEAEGVVEAEGSKLKAAKRERRVVERLREKRLEEWTLETGRKEQQEIDGLALDRHRRQQEERT